MYMSNAKTYQGKAAAIVVHHTAHRLRLESPVTCGADGWNATSTRTRHRVTCKRCLASLAKRDRAFQWEARGWFGSGAAWAHMQVTAGSLAAFDLRYPYRNRSRKADAARAIAVEEGRAL